MSESGSQPNVWPTDEGDYVSPAMAIHTMIAFVADHLDQFGAWLNEQPDVDGNTQSITNAEILAGLDGLHAIIDQAIAIGAMRNNVMHVTREQLEALMKTASEVSNEPFPGQYL